MAKVHSFGPLFMQKIDLPVVWGKKILVRGWTQEIEPPFRESKPLIFRLPSYKALVLGIWGKELTEEEALGKAIQRREVTYDDFQEEAGWTPAPNQDREENFNSEYQRLIAMVRDVDVHDRKASERLVSGSES